MLNPFGTGRPCARGAIFLAAACAGLCFLVAGCGGGEGSDRRAVYGNVSSSDQPIVQGSISFYPGPSHSGPVANTSIADGKYSFSESTGPAAGPYHVVVKFVRASEGGGKAGDIVGPPSKFPPAGTVSRPAGQGEQREFDVEVPRAGELRLDFDVLP